MSVRRTTFEVGDWVCAAVLAPPEFRHRLGRVVNIAQTRSNRTLYRVVFLAESGKKRDALLAGDELESHSPPPTSPVTA